jgi:hypothetical protein
MACLHGLLAIVTVTSTRNMNLQAPVFQTVLYLNYTTDHSKNIEQLKQSNATSLWDVYDVRLEPLSAGMPIAWLTFAFFAVTCAAHFGASVVYPSLYFSLLERKCNPLRWVEYAITASIMWLILAQAFAFVEMNALVLSTTMTAVTIASGAQCEFVARPHPEKDCWAIPLVYRLLFMLPGIVLFTSASIMLCIALFAGVRGDLPSFLLPVVLFQLAVFESFASVLFWQQLNPPSRWIYGEYAYQALSLLSKAVLGIVLIVNLLIFDEYVCVFEDC